MTGPAGRLDPATAQPRPELSFLTTRSRPRRPPAAAPAAPAYSAPPARPTYAAHPAAPTHAAPPAPSPTTPARSGWREQPSASLDLSTQPPPPPVAPAASHRRPPPRRAAPHRQTLLSRAAPTVTLSRIQSAVGTLTVTAVCGPTVGDLRLGCAYQLRDGRSSTVAHEGGNRSGPSDSPSPVLAAQRHEFETVVVDLRRCQEVTRLLFYAFSASHTPLAWGGTLIATTFGRASVETAIEVPAPAPVGALLSAYNIGGELVLRRAMATTANGVRECCLAYGFEGITWLDDWTATG